MTSSIRQPELLIIEDRSQATTSFGCDQEWYAEHWQRQAGCGPCTAATILYYLARSRDFLDHLYTASIQSRDNFSIGQPLDGDSLAAVSSHTREDFTRFMGDIWHFVTPGNMGVNEASILADGVSRYAAGHGVKLNAKIQRVPPLRKRKAPFSEFADFIRAGLEHDSPVAFLNLSNGRLDNLDSWHWVTIASISGDGSAEISDSGTRKNIDLANWYNTSWLGGAAVWFTLGGVTSLELAEDLGQR